MRDLTQKEIDQAPSWATDYSIDYDDDISWIGKDKVILNGDTGNPVLKSSFSGYFECIKPIPRPVFDIAKHEFADVIAEIKATNKSNHVSIEFGNHDIAWTFFDKNDVEAMAKALGYSLTKLTNSTIK